LLGLQQDGERRKGISSGLAISSTRDLLMQDASLKIAIHNPAGARSSLEEILKRTPEDLPALELLFQTYADQKQPKVGLEQIRYYALQRPKSAPLQFLLGRVLLAQGKLDAARAAFITVKAADPKYTQADLILAQLDHAAGRDEAARRTLNALLASKDTDRDTMVAAHLLMGALETAAGNHGAELEHWRKVLDADRNNVVALNNIAYVLLNYANQPEEALKYAQQAHELALDNPDIEDTVGWALYQKGIYGTAVQHLEHAVAQDGKATGQNLTVRKYHLAMAYFKHGDKKRGMDVLETALKTNSNIPEAQMAESVLAASK
jgi:tetratricopeptide (TPR) repeat protein